MPLIERHDKSRYALHALLFALFFMPPLIFFISDAAAAFLRRRRSIRAAIFIASAIFSCRRHCYDEAATQHWPSLTLSIIFDGIADASPCRALRRFDARCFFADAAIRCCSFAA